MVFAVRLQQVLDVNQSKEFIIHSCSHLWLNLTENHTAQDNVTIVVLAAHSLIITEITGVNAKLDIYSDAQLNDLPEVLESRLLLDYCWTLHKFRGLNNSQWCCHQPGSRVHPTGENVGLLVSATHRHFVCRLQCYQCLTGVEIDDMFKWKHQQCVQYQSLKKHQRKGGLSRSWRLWPWFLPYFVFIKQPQSKEGELSLMCLCLGQVISLL